MARYQVKTHLMRNSADAQYHICDMELDNHDVVAIVDPNQCYAEPDSVALEIARAMNTCRVMD